ncbi:hypothetical protein C8R44DRAFT_915967 [Mycena epipterygia]|nr:hypothetical protein C8R44DRAFT_915967 [Mycena epipterygia]
MNLSLFRSPRTTAPLVVNLDYSLFYPSRLRTVHTLSIPARTALLLSALKADARSILAMGFKSRVHLQSLQILAPLQIHGFIFKSTRASPALPSPCVSFLSLKSTLKTFAELDLLFEKGVSARKFASTGVDVFDDIHGASAGKGGSGEGEGSMDGEEEKAGERRIE